MQEKLKQLIQLAKERYGIDLELAPEASTYRTADQQNEILKRGPGVTKAAGEKSYHVWGLAFDVVSVTKGKRLDQFARVRYTDEEGEAQSVETVYATISGEEIGELGESIGLTWGGRFGDPRHFQYKPEKGGTGYEALMKNLEKKNLKKACPFSP